MYGATVVARCTESNVSSYRVLLQCETYVKRIERLAGYVYVLLRRQYRFRKLQNYVAENKLIHKGHHTRGYSIIILPATSFARNLGREIPKELEQG